MGTDLETQFYTAVTKALAATEKNSLAALGLGFVEDIIEEITGGTIEAPYDLATTYFTNDSATIPPQEIAKGEALDFALGEARLAKELGRTRVDYYTMAESEYASNANYLRYFSAVMDTLMALGKRGAA